MLDPDIGIQLKTRDWDVESIQLEHRILIGQDDQSVLAHSTRALRVLVTDNARDFVPLHASWLGQGRSHAGLLIASSRQYPCAKKTVGVWVQGVDAFLRQPPSASLDNQYIWLP